MTTITREQLEQIIFFAGEATCHPDPNYWLEFEKLSPPGVVLELARIALASSHATPIYQVQYGQQWRDVTKERYEDHRDHGSPIRIVYAEPPAPVEQSPEIIGYEHRMICGELRPVPKFSVEETHLNILKEELDVDAKLAEYSLNKSQTQPSPALMWLSESYLVHLVSLHRRPVFRHENGDIMLSCQTIACFVDEYFAERRTLAYRQYLYAKLLILDKPNESGYLAHLGETPRLKPRGIRLLNAMFNRFGFMIEEFGGYENLLKHMDKEIAGGEPATSSKQ
ncbi:hypothetical protein [Citrobacter freundii]|uniref:hypothetical protein n=1 Tax=Citrobacter freundii TaxID=546 RepID=UPI0023B102F9|nr:hypothetical protein [Citrobacter freundii]EJY4260344.1 hypothetical protein [Escherichia coli]ELD7994193.1 hypothetical protein [Citrobacter freundii]